ncbi:hypothetical protein D3C79_892040 [compost metagenome]
MAYSRPANRADSLPKLREKLTTVTHSSRAANSAQICSLASLLPSLTSRISTVTPCSVGSLRTAW